MAGVVATRSSWSEDTLSKNLPGLLEELLGDETLDLGCMLEHGAFERTPDQKGVRISSPEESLAFFMIRLSERLRDLPPAEPVDLMRYGQGIRSLEVE